MAKVEKHWYDWTISNRMWRMLRPMIKIIQDEAYGVDEFNYSIADCYAKKCLSMWLTHTQYIKMDIALKAMADELEALEEEVVENTMDIIEQNR